MTLKYEIESLDGIDDAVKPLYAEAEGKYVLQVEGVVPASRFNEVNQKYVETQDEARRRRGTVESLRSELGVEKTEDIIPKIKELVSGKGKGKPSDDDIRAVREQIEAQYKPELEGAQAQLRSMKMEAAKSQLSTELAKAGFPVKVAEMFAAANMSSVKLDEDGELRILTEEGKPMAGANGYATFADLAGRIAAAMPEFLVDKGKGGGGKPPASGASNGAKTVSRSQFDAMSQKDRFDFSKSGGKVVDG